MMMSSMNWSIPQDKSLSILDPISHFMGLLKDRETNFIASEGEWRRDVNGLMTELDISFAWECPSL